MHTTGSANETKTYTGILIYKALVNLIMFLFVSLLVMQAMSELVLETQ